MLTSRLPGYGIRLALALVMALALVGSLTAPVEAQEAIDLVLGGEGATSWDIANIIPGDSGTKTVTLNNAGTGDGAVTIWISDIVNTEGANPESESGDIGEPGELSQYLLLNLSSSRLSTNLSLPTEIDNFPQSASGSNYIKVNRLNAGETISLDWQWVLPSQIGNDVQGDSLSFSINYLLEELPSGGGGGGDDEDGGGRDGDGNGDGGIESAQEPQTQLVQVDINGKVTSWQMTNDGVLLETVEIVDPNGALILLLPEETTVLDSAGRPVDRITVEPVILSEPPVGTLVVGWGYDIQPHCTFDPAIKFTLRYDPQALSDGFSEENLVIAYYDEIHLEWVLLPSMVDSEARTVSTWLTHFSIYGLLVVVPKMTATPVPGIAVPSAPEVTLPPNPTVIPFLNLSDVTWICIVVGALLLFGIVAWRINKLAIEE